MAEYEPTSRRPIAQIFRRTAEIATRLCVRFGIHPDAISYLSILAALAAAICFWKSGNYPWLLVIATLFCFLRLWFNMLDGHGIAPKTTRSGERGLEKSRRIRKIYRLLVDVGIGEQWEWRRGKAGEEIFELLECDGLLHNGPGAGTDQR